MTATFPIGMQILEISLNIKLCRSCFAEDTKSSQQCLQNWIYYHKQIIKLLSLQLETIFVTSNVDFSLFDKIDNHYRKSRFVGQNVYAPQLDLSASHVSFHSFRLHPFSNLNRLNSSLENHQTLFNITTTRFFFHKNKHFISSSIFIPPSTGSHYRFISAQI